MLNKALYLVIDLVFILLGFCMIFGRKELSKVFAKSSLKYGTKYNSSQEIILFIIIWIVGLIFISGGIYKIIKTFL